MSSFEEYRKKLSSKYGTRPTKEDEEEEKKETKADGSSVWDDSFESFRKNMNSKYGADIDSAGVKSWFTNSESTIKGLSEYYKANDGSKWVSNYGADFTDSIANLKSTADAVGYYLRNNKSEFSDYDSLSKAFSEYRSFLEEAEKQNTSIRDFYSQFASEQEYETWNMATKAEEEYKKHFENIDTGKASQGWQQYLADEETTQNAPKHDLNGDGEEKWWEKLIGYLGDGGGVVDTTMPTSGVTQTVNALREDESYRKPNDSWTQEQKDAFGQLYLEAPEKAYAFAELTNKINNREKEEEQIKGIKDSATSSFGAGLGHTLGAIATAPLGLADYLGDLAYANAGRDIASDGTISPFEYSQAVTGGISEHLNDKGGTVNLGILGERGWGDVYGLGVSIAQSMSSGYLLGPAGTLVSYFGQGAASGVDDALARGATEDQAIVYGAALGAFEGIAEQIGIDNLFKLGSTSTLKGLLKNILKQAGAEGAEEGLTSILSNIADNVIMQDQSNFNLLVAEYMAQGMSEEEAKKKAWLSTVGDIAFDTIAGAVSGGVSGGLHTGVPSTINAVSAKKNFSGQAQDIVNEAVASENAEVKAVGEKYQQKLADGKKLSGWNLSELLEVTDNSKVKSAVEAQLTKLGETGDITAIADVITKQVQGYELSDKEQAIIDGSKYGQRIVNTLDREKIKSGNYDTRWAKEIGTRRLNADVYNKSLYDLAVDAKDAERKASLELKNMDAETENTSIKGNAAGGKISAPTGKVNQSVAKATMVDNEGNTVETKVAKIADADNGVVTLELDDGKTVKASDVDFGDSGIGLVYNTATEMISGVGGFNVDAANVMVKGFSPTGSVQAAAAYVSGVNEAYRYGAMGYPVSALATGNATSKLGSAQREAAYNLGKAYGTGKVAVKQANIDSFKANTTGQKAKKGKVYFDGSTVGKSLTERQRASLKGLRVIAEAMGVDIHIFESSVGKDGKRVGENGRYDPVKREIHIDLHAGADGNGVMLFTASHELTHHIREVAPEKFKAFADTLLEEYTKHGASLDSLIEEKIRQLKRNNRITPKMTEEQIYDLAYEEVVADSAEAMLVDSNAIEALSKKLQAQDKSLWEKIKDFIAKLVDRIKAAYEGLDPDSAEGNFTREMKDSAEKLQKLWVDALLEASEVDTVLGENGIIVDSKAESASLMSVRDVLNDAERQKVAKALAERFGVTQEEAMDWLTAETSLASLILNPKYSQYLDYTADPNEEAIKSNSDYPQGTVDFSNICKKRRDFTEVINRVLRNFPNHVFAATDLAKIRTIMEQEGMEVACAICYVEDRRQLDGPVAQDFIDSLKIYREGGNTRPDGKPFNANQLKAFSLIEGDTYTPSIYELISLKGRNSLKAKNPAMEEAWVKFNNARGMQSVRLLLNDAEYKRQILKYSPSVVKRKNDHGGLRIYSFSDMEMFHLIDIIQVITDSAAVGLSIQGYTKVNEYAKAVKDTGEKLNRSLIPKGDLGYHMENGRVVLDFDTVEGIDINHPDFFDNINNPNIGNIVIGINATQIKAAMTSKFIDQIIPFHTGQSGEVLGEKGIAAWENYKDFQSERDAKTEKKSAHQINIYTEVINAAEAEGKPITNKYEFVNKFLEVCRENNLIPRFSEFLNVDENGDYVYTEGYHKFLVDFKTFDQNTGEYLPQMPVKPIFENGYITQLLKDYVKSQKVKDAELAKTMPKVIERITNEIVKPEGTKYSDRNPRKVTESDVREILGNISSYHKDSYFPVRINTPKALIDAARTRGDVIENLPVVMQVKKAQQAMSNETTRSSIERAHGLSTDDMVAILRAMDEPTYIVYQENGRYVEIVRFETEAKNRAIAVLEIGENKNAIHMNGYEGGLYQVLVTAFAPDNYQYIKDILDNKKNTVLPVEKKKGASQRSSGSQVPSLLNESPFFEDTANRINGLERPKQNEGYAQENDISKDIVAQKAEIVNSKFSDREKTSYAPTFYSHMAKVVDDIKLEKMGSESLLNHLKNRGVKAEELKWSGIEVWLEGKKSVTKAELQEFVAGSQIQIVEQVSGEDIDLRYDGSKRAYNLFDSNGNVIDTFTYNEFLNGYVAESDEEIYSNNIELTEALREEYGVASAPKWAEYRLAGGTNYRELVFQLPNSTYSNRAMRGHWGKDAEGILVHARIQDFNVNGKKMLFIEELQSDWHNEGLAKGYTTKEYEDAVAVYDKLADAYTNANRAFNRYVRSSEFNHDPEDVRKKKFDWLRNKMEAAEKRMQTAEKDVDALKEKGMGNVPDAPFKNNYHEYVLKRLLRMAAEEGYDSIGWTPADIQSDRWSEDYAEAYRIEYDQEMPKFLRKYGKKWGTTVGKVPLPSLNNKQSVYDVNRQEEYKSLGVWKLTVSAELMAQGLTKEKLDKLAFDEYNGFVVAYDAETGREYDRAEIRGTGNSVWAMDISDSMKKSVLTEGQPLYSDRNNVGYHAGDLGKSEWLHMQGYSRGTGHFGTGTYFVGDEARISGDNTYGKRPHHAVDFSDYNLYKVRDDKIGYDLHEQLRVIDGGISQEWLDAAEKGQFSLVSMVDVYDLAEERFGEDKYSQEAMESAIHELAEKHGIELLSRGEYSKKYNIPLDDEDFLFYYVDDYLRRTFKDEAEKVNSAYANFRDAHFSLKLRFGYGATKQALQKVIDYQNANADTRWYTDKKDSFATVFMKALGYEGIDVRGTGLDNTAFGSVIYDLKENTVLYSDRVTNKKTLDFLENQEHVTVYRAMQVIDGELYPPMAAKVKSDDGKKKLVTPSKIGAWEQAVERPDLIRNGNKFELDKANGSSIQAAYNPYFHTSASPLNDQFSSAYKRPNLVIVEGEIPASELTSGYRAEFAKDTVGETKWHSGPVASKLKGDKARRVFLSRWFKPVRIVPDSEVASIVAKTLEGEDIEVPYNVVTPTLRTELEKAGVPIKYQDRGTDSYSNRSLLAGALETAAQNDIEKEKLKQYKAKIDLINSEEQKLHELREQIKELSFKKGPRDTEAIRKLQFEANQAANRINTYDRQLLNLESTKALKGVLEREKAQARKRDAQKYKEAIDRYREKSAKSQRELMDRYQESRKRGIESRNKTAMRHKIKDVVNELNNYLLKGTKDKHVPIELQKAVAEALDAVNMDTVGAEERIAKLKAEMMRASTPEAVQDIAKKIEHIEEMGGNMAKKISRLKTAYDGIINSDDPLVANSHDDVISSSIEKVMEYVGETSLRDMSLPQLEAVYDMYNMVLFSIRNANKAFKAKKSEEISVIANRVMEEIDKLGKKKAYSTKAGQTVSEFDWNNQKPVYAFERIGSDTFTEVFNNVRAGEDIWAEDMTDAQEYREAEYKKHKYDSWDFKKRYAFTSSSGMKFELTIPQIMSLYAYSKREQAAEHLKRGGFVFDETTEVTVKNKLGVPVKFNPTEATAYNISEETLASIISKLTAEQKAFVDEMQDYLSTTMGEKGNEVSLALYGVKLFKEKFYFPLKSATQFMAKAKEQQKGEVKIKNSGFTKETVRKANNPIVLTPFMDVWAGHVNEMSMYHAFTLALEDFYRVYNYKTPTSETMATESVEMFLQNAHGKAATKYIDQLLKDLNGGARVDSTAGIINKLTGMFKKSAVFASLSVVVQQPSAIARATALVDTKYFVGTPSRHKETWAEVKKYAPVAVIKEMGYFDTGMGKSSVEWLKGDKTLMDKVDDVASKAPALADEYAWAAIWNAVKRETVHNNPKLKTSSDEFLKLVGERFTEVVTKTQVYDSVLSRSANMRSKDTGMKMVTAFMGEPTTSLNMLQDALIQGKRGNKKYAAKAIGGVISSMILNSILVSIVYAGRDDDEEKTYAEKYISTLTEELLDSFNPLTLVPFVKDIVSIVQGYDIERSDMAVITDLINAWNNLDSDNRSVYRKVEDFGGAIATIFGLPVKNVMRDVRGMYNTINSFINGEKTTGAGIGNAVVESITGKEKSNGQQLYEAMVKGDSAQVQRIKGRFEDQTAINSAIRKALRENDPRIKEAAEARYNGDITEYMKIAKEIIAEGNFKQDDIVAAINSEINALKKGEGETSTSTSSDKAVSLYSIGDYYSAIMTGATAAAYAVKEDLIETDIANGKDRDEAEASFNSKLTNHIRDMYEEGSITDYKAKEVLTYYAGKTEEEADSKVQYWNFKKEYPDYDLSESAVSKYYSDVQSSGISVDVYYEYSKLRAKAQGEDLNGDGKTDSGSLKKEVMQIINSLPISSYQKDALYYLNGWSKSTIWEAPWH